MANLREDIETGAKWIANALVSSGYRADFTPQSLWEIDRFFDEQTAHGEPKRGGLLSENLGQRIFSIGSYMGEVLRQHLGGTWKTDDGDPQGEVNIELYLADGTLCWPVQRAMKRLRNGDEDGIAVWGAALGLLVGARLDPPATPPNQQRGFFQRLFGR